MSFLQDIRYGLRMIVKAPAFTAVAMLALALGVCANTTIFSFINGLVLRPLTGVKDSSSLVAVYPSDYSGGLYGGSSYPEYMDLRTQVDAFESLAAYDSAIFITPGATGAERLRGFVVTGNYFEVLGVKALMGRTLQPADDDPANAPSVVISDGLWRRRFNANPNVIGQSLRLDKDVYTIVGVADPSFRGLRLGTPPELWVPMSKGSDYAKGERNSRAIQMTGRLKPGVTLEQAQTQVTTIAARLAQAYPQSNLGTLERPNDPRPITVVRESRVGPQAQVGILRVFMLLSVVVGLVLLIACANVANLLLARASVRRREIAVRLAVGASRGRLVRQLLTESLLLALLGGAAGLLLTQWTAGLLPKFFPERDAVGLDLSIDWRVLVFTLGVSVLTGVLFGLTPALQATRLNLLPSLKADDKAYGQRGRRIGLRDALVISQLALSLVLLISAGLFVRSLRSAISFDPGFAAQNLLVASMEYGGNAVGKRLQIGSETPFIEIIGVARNAKYRNLREHPPLPFIYIPLGQEYQPGMTLMVRSAGDPELLIGSVRNEMSAVNKDVISRRVVQRRSIRWLHLGMNERPSTDYTDYTDYRK